MGYVHLCDVSLLFSIYLLYSITVHVLQFKKKLYVNLCSYVDKFVLPDSWLDHGKRILRMRENVTAVIVQNNSQPTGVVLKVTTLKKDTNNGTNVSSFLNPWIHGRTTQDKRPKRHLCKHQTSSSLRVKRFGPAVRR